MRIRDVDFPPLLLEAQQKGSLVVFAGAGVSMPSPSNYPSFATLADQVADGVLSRESNEPLDRFLGRLAVRGVKVHERVKQFLSDPKSAPNSMHTSLLRLFAGAARVRLVTTNFDSHFTTAAHALFDGSSGVEIFSAPALPLGGEIFGIVHLHGSVDKPSDRLILTDADFGRAYLTEGWATRFLQRLFADYIVVFAGYSHEDPVMNYLARGLPPESEVPTRFALTVEGDNDRWRYLGIVPVTYRLTDDSNKHSSAAIAITGWADLAQTGALEQETKIKVIAELPFPLSPEDSDYIEHALKNIASTRFFARHAKRVDWLRWTESKGFLTPLFRFASPINDIQFELANWFAQTFVCEHVGDALAVVQRQGQTLNPVLWNAIAHRLWTNKVQRNPATLAKWIPLLLNCRPSTGMARLLEYLLNDARFPEDRTTAILLFDYLTKPELLLKKDIWRKSTEGDGETVDFELGTEGDDYFLTITWRQFFQPNLHALGDQLIWILTAHIEEGYRLLRAVGEAGEDWDPLSFSRGLIENSSQGGPPDGISVLIDAARDSLEWYLANRPATAGFLIGTWFSSDSNLLKRLAIFGAAKNTQWTPDKKISWLLEHDLLFARGLKHEVFLVLENSYRGASEESKLLLLERVILGPTRDMPENSKQYEIYNLLHWLRTKAPDCRLAEEYFTQISAKHPEFGPRERPDLDVVIGPVQFGSTSPISSSDLLAKNPEEQIELLLNYKPQNPLAPERGGLLNSVTDAVVQSYEWGVQLVQSLEKRKRWDSDVWSAIVDGWKHTQLAASQWDEVLGFLAEHEMLLPSASREISFLLENGIKTTSNPIPTSSFPLAMTVATKLWAVCASVIAMREKSDDWLFVAMNHPAGLLATFWLYLISNVRNQSRNTWTGIPKEHKQFLEDILTGGSYAADLGRVILSSRLHFLYSSDEAWTIDNVIPLLNWSKNSRRALQAWHGYLGLGTWDNNLIPHLMQYYEAVFSIFSSEFGQFRDQFCAHLAGIAAFGTINPITDGWLLRFIRDADREDRIKWASHLWQMLNEMKEPAKHNAWTSWIKGYWERRITGVPVPLDPAEVVQMIAWSPRLGSAFPEAVDMILKSPRPKWKDSSSYFIYDELSKSDYPNRYPGPAARLVLHTLRSGLGSPLDFAPIENIVKRVAGTTGADRDLLDICNELARLGYARAGDLRTEVHREHRSDAAGQI